VHTIAQAVRSFTDEVNRVSETNEMNRHPSDYELYHVGTYDDQAGHLEPVSPPILIVRGKDVFTSKE